MALLGKVHKVQLKNIPFLGNHSLLWGQNNLYPVYMYIGLIQNTGTVSDTSPVTVQPLSNGHV